MFLAIQIPISRRQEKCLDLLHNDMEANVYWYMSYSLKKGIVAILAENQQQNGNEF